MLADRESNMCTKSDMQVIIWCCLAGHIQLSEGVHNASYKQDNISGKLEHTILYLIFQIEVATNLIESCSVVTVTIACQ